MTLVAFDIDGALTKDSGMEQLRRALDSPDNTVGIVSSRNQMGVRDFIQSKGINGDRINFARGVILKAPELRRLERKYPDEKDKIYYGSNIRDMLEASLAGWDYEQL